MLKPTPTREIPILCESSSVVALYDVGTRLFTVGLSGEADGELDQVRELVAWREDVNR